METESLEEGVSQRPQAATRTEHPAQAHPIRFLRQLAYMTLLGVGLALLVFQVLVFRGLQTDFCQDYIAAHRLLQGVPVYQTLHCWAGIFPIPTSVEYDTHPPFSVLFFLPFGLLPRVTAYTLWGLGCLVFYLVSGILLLGELGWLSLRGIAFFVAGSLCWPLFLGAEQFQNLTQLTLFLLVVAWILERKGHSRWAGGLLGLATLLKLWPAVVIGVALLHRRWQVTLMGGLVVLLGTALTLPLLGLKSYLTYLGPIRANETPWVQWDSNSSLVGFLTRALSGFHEKPIGQLPSLAGPLNLDQAVLWGEVVAALLLGATLGFLWWCRQSQSETVELLGNGLLLTVLLLVFPLSWFNELITLLLPATTTILALRQLPRPPWWWFLLLGVSVLPLLGDTSQLALLAVWVQHQVPLLSRGAILLIGLPTCGLLLAALLQASLLWQARALSPRRAVLTAASQSSGGSVQHA